MQSLPLAKVAFRLGIGSWKWIGSAGDKKGEAKLLREWGRLGTWLLEIFWRRCVTQFYKHACGGIGATV
jgi:hypothetical protein